MLFRSIWAFGAVLHEMLTGRLPVGSLGVMPRGLDRAVAKALAADPDDRYQRMDDLLVDLREQLGLTYLFISHDLSIVEYVSDDVAVMYLGRIVERAPAERLCRQPLHPYTHALFSAVPAVDPGRRRRRIVLPGDVPSPAHPPAGCRFHARCPLAESACLTVDPPATDVAGQIVHCHVAARELAATGSAADA